MTQTSRRGLFGLFAGAAAIVALPGARAATAAVAPVAQEPFIIGVAPEDLTLTLDEFSRRIMQPAMASLARQIDDDAMNNWAAELRTASRKRFRWGLAR